MKKPRREPLVYVLTATNFKAARDELGGICDFASRAGWRLEVFDNAMYGFHVEGSDILSRCDGVISHLGDPLRDLSMEGFRKPLVMLDGSKNSLHPCAWGVVGSDSAAIGSLAAEHLLGLDLASYAYLAEAAESSPWRWSMDRQSAFTGRIAAAGKTVMPLYPTREGGHWVREAPLIGATLAALPRPVGLFCPTDIVAKIAYSACRSAGLVVPNDVAILGVDDDTFLCESATPALSSIAVDFFGAGFKAASMLDGFLAARRRPASPRAESYEPTGIVQRGSTRRLSPAVDPLVARTLEFIRLHACEGLRASEVVRWMHVSERKAEYLFFASGLTLREAIVLARLEHVRHELRATRKPIERIAGDCGFSSAVYLANLFRKRFGTTMRAFRKAAVALPTHGSH